MNRCTTALIAAALLGTALTPTLGEAASGITRRTVSASDASWHGTYVNEGNYSQRIVLRATGDWSYEPRSACTMAGAPWSSETRQRAGELRAPECAPWSLLAQLDQGGEAQLFCVDGRDYLTIEAGARLSFTINEFEGSHADNTGALNIEIVALDLTPTAARPYDSSLALETKAP